MTDTVTAKLAEWAALTEAATEGPWTVDASAPTGDRFIETPPPGVVIAMTRGQWNHATSPADAEFIAAAREMVPALLGFVREVRAGHAREPYVDEPSEGFCRDCQRGGAAGTWPCPTEQAARKWIGGEG